MNGVLTLVASSLELQTRTRTPANQSVLINQFSSHDIGVEKYIEQNILSKDSFIYEFIVKDSLYVRNHPGFKIEGVLENYFLTSQPKHMLWVLKRTISMNGSFEHPKHMFELMDKDINAKGYVH